MTENNRGEQNGESTEQEAGDEDGMEHAELDDLVGDEQPSMTVEQQLEHYKIELPMTGEQQRCTINGSECELPRAAIYYLSIPWLDPDVEVELPDDDQEGGSKFRG